MELASEREARWKAVGATTEKEFESKSSGAHEELQRHISPPGTLGLSDALDRRRIDHGIPDEAFSVQALFEFCYLVQLPSTGGDKFFDGGVLVRPDNRRAADDASNPRAVIVSAGLLAKDQLRSNGVELGDVVYFQRLSPFRLYYARIGGLQYHLIVVAAGDITGSESLATRIECGETQESYNCANGQHEYKTIRSEPIG